MDKVKQFLKENWIYLLSFIYILSPIDLIPGDLATGIGVIDDLGVLVLTGGYAFVRFLVDSKKSNGKTDTTEG
jgi:uncharacterized membrane protein YkvA (DUF1232 family)